MARLFTQCQTEIMKKNNIEQRIMSFTPSMDPGRENHLTGHAALYGHEYRYTLTDEEGGSIDVVEKIMPGAFTKELIERSDVKATINHKEWPVLARSKNGTGTMTLTPDERGLYFDFVPSSSHADIVESVERRDIDQCSYKYVVDQEDITIQEDGSVLREIRSFASLHDICIATYPAYSQTYVTTEKRTRDNILEAIKDKNSQEEEKDEQPEFVMDWEHLDMLIKTS